MTATATAPAPSLTKLSEPTSLLLFIAARVPALASSMQLELVGETGPLRYNRNVRWLEPHPLRREELTFNADKFAATLDACSSGERHCKLWLLNVWNPGHAQTQGWTFDLFAALRSLDSGNRDGIADWMPQPLFP